MVALSFCWSLVSSAGTCGGTFRKDSGDFYSPNYPEKYPNNKDCIYKVLASSDARTRLNCTSYIQRSKACTKDYLRINDSFYCGRNAPDGKTQEVYCGSSWYKVRHTNCNVSSDSLNVRHRRGLVALFASKARH
ncbi:bone morphogenetic protein 1-like [Oratosquilla oratoria]|uniref:bone morphogenetic protein 1-like n=1 Tax=Oratosquilla oratoria TaxID=337810 RepID=UPI003F765B4C